MELLAQALRSMTAAKDLNLNNLNIPSSSALDTLMEALVANQANNPSLHSIDINYVAGYKNSRFSDAAKAHVDTLKAKGVNVIE